MKNKQSYALQILVPQYKETDEIIKPLLDSIAVQQNIDFDTIGVIICNDGSDVLLTQEFLDSYPFSIEYHIEEHRGVSATRNSCLDYATAEYVMFCDADDMFCNVVGIWFVLNEAEHSHFDSLTSVFMEEGRIPKTGETYFLERGRIEQGGADSTFVHGKVHRRKYLIEQNIRWNPDLTIHEDSYFNILCQKIAQQDKVKYCPFVFYLWKWRDESVCRHDPKYMLKTYNNMLESNTALVRQFLKRNRLQEAQQFVCSMIYDAYFTMNKEEWLNQDNQEYRYKTEKRFQQYYLDFKHLYETIPDDQKNGIIVGMKNRFFQEGMFTEKITFDDWMKHILELN